jgi:hypothetical protein
MSEITQTGYCENCQCDRCKIRSLVADREALLETRARLNDELRHAKNENVRLKGDVERLDKIVKAMRDAPPDVMVTQRLGNLDCRVPVRKYSYDNGVQHRLIVEIEPAYRP